MEVKEKFETYLTQIFDDLLLKDNGKAKADLEAYYFVKVIAIIFISIVHAPTILFSKENVQSCLQSLRRWW